MILFIRFSSTERLVRVPGYIHHAVASRPLCPHVARKKSCYVGELAKSKIYKIGFDTIVPLLHAKNIVRITRVLEAVVLC